MNKKRSEAFELTKENASTLTKRVMNFKEQMENEYRSIYDKMDEEERNINIQLKTIKNYKTTDLEKLERQSQLWSRGHGEEIDNFGGQVTGNGRQHKSTVRGSAVITSRVRTLVKETEENFNKLLFVQSR